MAFPKNEYVQVFSEYQGKIFMQAKAGFQTLDVRDYTIAPVHADPAIPGDALVPSHFIREGSKIYFLNDEYSYPGPNKRRRMRPEYCQYDFTTNDLSTITKKEWDLVNPGHERELSFTTTPWGEWVAPKLVPASRRMIEYTSSGFPLQLKDGDTLKIYHPGIVIDKPAPTPTCVEEKAGPPVNKLCCIRFTLKDGEKITGYIQDGNFFHHCAPNPCDLGEIINQRLEEFKKTGTGSVNFFVIRNFAMIHQALLGPNMRMLGWIKTDKVEINPNQVLSVESCEGEFNGYSADSGYLFSNEELELISQQKAQALIYTTWEADMVAGTSYLLSFDPAIGAKELKSIARKYNLINIAHTVGDGNPAHQKRIETIKSELLKKKVLILTFEGSD
jgi:hypothetical protein